MRIALLLALALSCAAPQDRSQSAPATQPTDFDLLIAGGRVLDGTGAPAVLIDPNLEGKIRPIALRPSPRS